MVKTIFSGIQPSGDLHLGNYLGAISRWVKNQDDGQNIFCIVDLHAITVFQDQKELKEKILETAALLIACGIDPQKSLLFVQSGNSDHANLAWILNCNVSIGQLNRMTQFKEKQNKKDFVTAGLYNYPVLMAADILLYDTTEVPVGEDQKQHVELTRDIAERFNSRYGETFVVPKAVVPKVGGRVMNLLDPDKKMSKSDNNQTGVIRLLDEPEIIRKKILGATTDSFNKIVHGQENPAISNLIEIYSLVNEVEIPEVEKKFKGVGYKEFKENLAEGVINLLLPIQNQYKEIRNGNLFSILQEQALKAKEMSSRKLKGVYKKVGVLGNG